MDRGTDPCSTTLLYFRRIDIGDRNPACRNVFLTKIAPALDIFFPARNIWDIRIFFGNRWRFVRMRFIRARFIRVPAFDKALQQVSNNKPHYRIVEYIKTFFPYYPKPVLYFFDFQLYHNNKQTDYTYPMPSQY